MEKSRLKEQVDTIRQSFGYINRYKGETFVIKISGALIGDPLFPLLIKDIVLLHTMGIRIVLVPGAKNRIDEVLSTFGVRCETVDNIRISTPDSIPFIKMAAFDVSNKIMTLLAENDTTAVIGNWVRARGIGVRDGIDYQSSGVVEKLKTDIVRNVLQDGLVPIFPNIGWNAKGKPYNISSNELALTISRELEAAKLFFLTDSGGIPAAGYTVPEDNYVSSDGIISQLTVAQAAMMLEQNRERCGDEHLSLLSLAHNACLSGVARVHIINGGVEGMILKEIFSNRGLGTMIYANQHDNIRPMVEADIAEALLIMQPLVDEGILVARGAEDIERCLEDYVVYEVDGIIHGCGALHRYPGGMGEIAGIAVDEAYANLGIGKKLISYFLDKARQLKLKSVFVLTTHTTDWFITLGFKEADISALPEIRRQTYNERRKSRVLTYSLTRRRAGQAYSVE